MKGVPKHKCAYRLCQKSVWGMKPKRKYCTPEHAQKEQYLAKHPEARANKLVETKPAKQGRPKIKERRCEFPGCKTNIDYKHKAAKYCDDTKHTSTTAKTRRRVINRTKKRKFYERHGIKFDKTIRNRKITELNPTTNGVIYEGQTLLYENYKDPLKPIEKGKGFGYYGTVAITDDREYVQCHVCGNLFSNVGVHLRKHKISVSKYKEMYQLSVGTALISEPVREKMQELVFSKNPIAAKGGLPPWLQTYNKKVQSGQIKHPGTKRREGGLSLERRNQLGICPDQVLAKIQELADKLGGTAPSWQEFHDEYQGRYLHTITYFHGSYSEAVRKLGMKTASELREHSRESLIEALVEFNEKYGRIPMTSDFKRGLLPSRGAYFRYFGTLNNARIEAGLNAVIPMPFGQMVELSPEQYLE